MKKALYILCLLSIVSCIKEIEFNGDFDGEKLVLYSFPTPDSYVSARLYKSNFFLSKDSYSFKKALTGAEVWVEVNGKDRYRCEEVSNEGSEWSNMYISEYIPKCGDRITVSASYKGFPSVSGETVIPEKPLIKIEDVSSSKVKNDYSRTDFSLIITDQSEENNYYRITALKEIRFHDAESYWSREHLYSNDIVFYKTDITAIAESIDGDDPMIPDYFDDGAFNAEEHSFPIWMKYYDDDGYYSGKNLITVENMSEDLYRYCVSLYKSEESGDLGSVFGEPVSIFNNIKDGIGCVGAYCSSEIVFN